MPNLIKLIESNEKNPVRKALLGFDDGSEIETVLIKHPDHYTACISSQVGCPLGCGFCATGMGGFTRNLTAEEITDQIYFWNDYLKAEKKRVKNVVFMGMGEPFLNWENVKAALDIMTNPKRLKIGQRHISISTCGIIDKIRDFTKENTQINLAISLHSANPQTRSMLMPINRTQPLEKLIKICLQYVEQTRRKLFFEYTLLQGINDTDKEIELLAKLIQKHYLFHLNLIRYNAAAPGFHPTNAKRLKQITNYLESRKVSFTLRKSYGADISAACGQLKTSHITE